MDIGNSMQVNEPLSHIDTTVLALASLAVSRAAGFVTVN
jgi:hypothetical protein